MSPPGWEEPRRRRRRRGHRRSRGHVVVEHDGGFAPPGAVLPARARKRATHAGGRRVRGYLRARIQPRKRASGRVERVLTGDAFPQGSHSSTPARSRTPRPRRRAACPGGGGLGIIGLIAYLLISAKLRRAARPTGQRARAGRGDTLGLAGLHVRADANQRDDRRGSASSTASRSSGAPSRQQRALPVRQHGLHGFDPDRALRRPLSACSTAPADHLVYIDPGLRRQVTARVEARCSSRCTCSHTSTATTTRPARRPRRDPRRYKGRRARAFARAPGGLLRWGAWANHAVETGLIDQLTRADINNGPAAAASATTAFRRRRDRSTRRSDARPRRSGGGGSPAATRPGALACNTFAGLGRTTARRRAVNDHQAVAVRPEPTKSSARCRRRPSAPPPERPCLSSAQRCSRPTSSARSRSPGRPEPGPCRVSAIAALRRRGLDPAVALAVRTSAVSENPSLPCRTRSPRPGRTPARSPAQLRDARHLPAPSVVAAYDRRPAEPIGGSPPVVGAAHVVLRRPTGAAPAPADGRRRG
jgi:hypothetical protein